MLNTSKLKDLSLAGLIALSYESYLKSKENTTECPKEVVEEPQLKAVTKLFKTQDLLINNKLRTVTIALVIDNTGHIRAGYSVLNEGDEFDKDLGKTISLGRAMNDKTNLFKDKHYGISTDLESDFGRLFLKHLSDVVLRDIESGKYQIKGIK